MLAACDDYEDVEDVSVGLSDLRAVCAWFVGTYELHSAQVASYRLHEYGRLNNTIEPASY